MSTLVRWCKFNMVGAVGMVFQLTMLAVFLRWTKGHYLFATAAAIELTLVHNFVWHLNFTWHDRRDSSALVCQFLRFNASNGAVSILGNLAVMRLLVQGFRTPVLFANSFAVLICSAINFCLGHKWAFVTRRYATSTRSVECPNCR
jgi:putative flippase GtrA